MISYLDFLNAKNDYIKASRRTWNAKLAAATGGNISVRLDEGTMIVKPSGITLGEASEENLIITDLDGKLLEGKLKPTKETLLHGELYTRYHWIKAIVHVHPIYTMAVANLYDEMPLVTKQMKQITNRPVAICKIKNNTVDRDGMDMIHSIFQQYPDTCCFMLEEHGLVAVGKTAIDACYTAELVEENAKVFLMMRQAYER